VLVRNLAKEELAEESRGEEASLAIRALVLAPTREIAIQAQEYISFLCKSAEPKLIISKAPLLLIGGLDLKE